MIVCIDSSYVIPQCNHVLVSVTHQMLQVDQMRQQQPHVEEGQVLCQTVKKTGLIVEINLGEHARINGTWVTWINMDEVLRD